MSLRQTIVVSKRMLVVLADTVGVLNDRIEFVPHACPLWAVPGKFFQLVTEAMQFGLQSLDKCFGIYGYARLIEQRAVTTNAPPRSRLCLVQDATTHVAVEFRAEGSKFSERLYAAKKL